MQRSNGDGSNAGGFDFEFVKRNAMLAAKGVKPPTATKTGTTIAGVIYKVCVGVCAGAAGGGGGGGRVVLLGGAPLAPQAADSLFTRMRNVQRSVLTCPPDVAHAVQDGVVLAADTRSTSGTTVADKNCEKIHYIAPNIYCCGAGTAADTENVTGAAQLCRPADTHHQPQQCVHVSC
jgi:hypothetical protein